MRTRRSPASRRATASARCGGSASARIVRRPERASWRARARRRSAALHLGHAAPVPGDPQRADGGREGRHAVDEADLDQHVVGDVGAGPATARTARAPGASSGSGAAGSGDAGHAVSSSSSVPVIAARSSARPRWTWALSVPSGRPRIGRELGVREVVDVAEDDGDAVALRQRREVGGEPLAVRRLQRDPRRVGGDRRRRARARPPRAARAAWTGTAADARPVAAQVEHDRREPAADAQLADPVRLVAWRAPGRRGRGRPG